MGFFNSIGKSRTYLNILYLLIAYPLGIIYFIFIIVGLALGFGLFITWFGIPILVGVMYIWLGFAYFERNLAKTLLRIEIPYSSQRTSDKPSIWQTLKHRFTNSYTWKTFTYLLIKFPMGIVSFVILVVFISLTLSLIATPFAYIFYTQGNIPQCSGSDWCWTINLPFAILAGIIGIFMIFISLLVFNGFAKASGLLAKALLSRGPAPQQRVQAKREISKKKATKKTSKRKK